MPYYEQTGLTAQQRDERIVELRRAGLSYAAIGRRVRMSESGVCRALQRMEEGRPGRDPRP